MSGPRRIQRKRTKGWRLPEGAVCVTRRGRWGNPFKPGQKLGFPYSEMFGPEVRDLAHAVEVFAAYARISCGYAWLARHELRGKTLACWCKEGGDPCHGDVLLKIANDPGEDAP